MKRLHIFIVVGIVTVLTFILGAIYIVRQAITQTTLGLMIAGDSVKAESLVANLDSSNRDLVMTSLGILANRSDSAGKVKAIALLRSKDNYIWFNAALYLGAINERDAIPYLIKGLKHPASRSHGEVAILLEAITEQAFGKNQEQWIEWWKIDHPNSKFIFSYPDLEREASNFDETSQILITSVVDPLRISHMGPQVRLIGIKLKEDAKKKDAINLLHRLLDCQFVQLEFDNGPKLDNKGARRAFVYWTTSSPVGKMSRRGLSPIPFKRKTLINTYLLESGLYETDFGTVEDEKMKQTLKKAIKKIRHNQEKSTNGLQPPQI